MQHLGTYFGFFDDDPPEIEDVPDPDPKEKAKLDAKFSILKKVAEELCSDLPKSQENRGKAWIRRIDDLKNTIHWPSRIDYIKLLILCLQRRKLVGMFSMYPEEEIELPQLPTGLTIHQIAEGLIEAHGGEGDGPPVQADISGDLRTYAAVQEIPGFGVQCFFAASKKEPITKWLNNEKLFVPIPLKAMNNEHYSYKWKLRERKDEKDVSNKSTKSNGQDLDKEDTVLIKEWLRETEKVAADALQQTQKVAGQETNLDINKDYNISAIEKRLRKQGRLSVPPNAKLLLEPPPEASLDIDKDYEISAIEERLRKQGKTTLSPIANQGPMMTEEEFADIERRFRDLKRNSLAPKTDLTTVCGHPSHQQELPFISTPLPKPPAGRSFNYDDPTHMSESDFSGESVYSTESLRPKDKKPRQTIKRNTYTDFSVLSPQGPMDIEFEEHSSLNERILDHAHNEQSSDEEESERKENIIRPFQPVPPGVETSLSPKNKIGSSPMQPQKFSPEQLQSLVRSHVKLLPAKRADDNIWNKSSQQHHVRETDGEIVYSSPPQYSVRGPDDECYIRAPVSSDLSKMPRQDPAEFSFIEVADAKDILVESYFPEKFLANLDIYEEEFRRARNESSRIHEADQKWDTTTPKSSTSISIKEKTDSSLGKRVSKLSVVKKTTKNKKSPLTTSSKQDRIPPRSLPKKYGTPKNRSIHQHTSRFITIQEGETESEQYPTPEVMKAGTPDGQSFSPRAPHVISPLSPYGAEPSPQEEPRFPQLMPCDLHFEPQPSMGPARFLSFSECLSSPREQMSVEPGIESPIISRASPHMVSNSNISPRTAVSPRALGRRSMNQRPIHGSPHNASPKSPGFSPISVYDRQSFQQENLSPTTPFEGPIHSTFLESQPENISCVPCTQHVDETFDIIPEYAGERLPMVHPAALDRTYVDPGPQMSSRRLPEILPYVDRTYDVFPEALSNRCEAVPPTLGHTYDVSVPQFSQERPPVDLPVRSHTYEVPPTALDHTYKVSSPQISPKRLPEVPPGALDCTHVSSRRLPEILPSVDRSYDVFLDGMNHSHQVPPALDRTYEAPFPQTSPRRLTGVPPAILNHTNIASSEFPGKSATLPQWTPLQKPTLGAFPLQDSRIAEGFETSIDDGEMSLPEGCIRCSNFSNMPY